MIVGTDARRIGASRATKQANERERFLVAAQLQLDEALNPLFLACVESVEESVYDALFTAETMTGRDGNVLEALPKDRVVKILKRVQKTYDA